MVARSHRPQPPGPGLGTGMGRVLIVEDDAQVAMAFERALQRAGYRTTLSATLAEATERINDPDIVFDVAIIDLVLPDGFGGHLVQPLLKRKPLCRSLIVSGGKREEVARETAQSGAHAYFSKPIGPESLLSAVDEAHQSTLTWRTATAAPARSGAGESVGDAPYDLDLDRATARLHELGRLTPTQSLAAACMLLGDSNKEIGERLGISAHGAKHHVHNVLGALGIEQRSQLWRVLLADAHGDVDAQFARLAARLRGDPLPAPPNDLALVGCDDESD